MPTLQEVRQQIEKLPHKYIFYTRKEIRYLPQVLSAGEHIYALTSGFMNGHSWLIVCTSKRVIFLDRGFFYGLRQVQMNLDRIQSVESSVGLLFGSIRIWDSASAITITMVLRSSLIPFVRTVQEAMELYKRYLMADMVATGVNVANIPHGQVRPPANPAPAPTQPPSPVSHLPWVGELERLTKLKTDGVLTDQEFAVAKAKLLAGN